MMNWLKFVLTTIVIVAISLMFSMYQLGKIEAHADECERIGLIALEFANNSPYYYASDNFTCLTPDHLNAINIYINMTQEYFACESGRVSRGEAR